MTEAKNSTGDLNFVQLRKLLSQASDHGLDEAAREQIESWLTDNQSACDDYVDYVTLEALLDQRFARVQLSPELLSDPSSAADNYADPQLLDQLRQLSPDQSDKRVRSTTNNPRNFTHKTLLNRVWKEYPRSPALLAAAAAIMLLAGIWMTRSDSLATVVAVNDVSWGESHNLAIGDALADDWIELEAGTVQLAFRNTAMVALTGPARFQVLSESMGQLEHGHLVANVPAAAIGFRVQSPDLTVVDLGTGFELNVDAPHAGGSGTSRVHVVEGRVQLEPNSTESTVELVAGQRANYMRNATAGQKLQVLDAKKVDPRTKGSLSFNAEHPVSLGYKAYLNDATVHVFLERSYFDLPHEVRVNHTRPGKYHSLEVPRSVIPAGTCVHSYLLHFSPESRRKKVQGSVTFPGKILGVIGDTDMLNATNDVLGAAWTLRCQHPERGIESTPDPNYDIVTISSTRRTLSVNLQTESIDQLRVLVECDQ